MKKVISIIALILSGLSTAHAVTDLGEAYTAVQLNPDRIALVDADWETTPGKERALVGYFFTSKCYADDMAEGVIVAKIRGPQYVLIQRNPGHDCGAELFPPKSWYKLEIDLLFDDEVPSAFVINGKPHFPRTPVE